MSLLRAVCFVVFYGIVSFASATWAERNSDLKPTLIKPGKVVAQERFDASQLGPDWAIAKGDWQAKEGMLVGQEKQADMHAAVLTLKKPFKNAAIRFTFKLDGATGFNLSFNHAQGHLFRVAIAEDGLTLTKDKDKKDPNSKIETLAKAQGKFPAGQWHTLLVEVDGGKVNVQADNGAKLSAENAELAVEITGYRFVTKGASLFIDDVIVWQAQP